VGPRVRDRTTIAYFATFVVLGLMSASLGPSLDVLRRRVGVGLGTIAVLFTVSAAGYLAGSVVLGRRYDRGPGHPVMAASLLAGAAGLVMLGFGPTLVTLGAAVAVMGFAAGGIDTGGNTLLTWIHVDGLAPAMVAMHAMFGVGASLAPLALAASRSATSGGIAAALVVMAVLAVTAAAAVGRRPSPAAPDGRATGARPAPSRRALVAVASFFFLYVGLELGFGGWIFTFAEARGFHGPTTAAWLTSAFWIAFTVGRLLGVATARRFSATRLLLGDAALAVAGAGALVAAGSNTTGIWLATVVIGLALATMYPSMMSLAAERITVTGTTSAWFVGGAGAGSLVLPWTIGQLFARSGPGTLPWFLLVSTVVCTGSVVVARWALPEARCPVSTRT